VYVENMNFFLVIVNDFLSYILVVRFYENDGTIN
jgi:hypothetical protein